MGSNVIRLIYYMLVLACVGVSTYLSYYGYRSSFEDIALPFTVILGIGLFGSDALIQSARERGRTLIWPLLLFFAFAVFSGASNFNFLYTNFMQKDVVRQTLDSQYARFQDTLIDTKDKLQELNAVVAVNQKRTELEREVARLRDQTTDPLRFGCGERCLEHLANIESLLGKPLTGLAVPPIGAPPQSVEDWLERVSAQARRDFDQSVLNSGYASLEILLEDINRLLAEYQAPDRSMVAVEGLGVLREIATESEDIERRANTFLPNGEEVDHANIDASMGRLGEIVYSFQNAFQERPNMMATILSAILSIIIDVFPVLFALVAFVPDAGRVNQGARRGRAGTRVLD